MASLRVIHVIERLRLGGPLHALAGASRHFSADAPASHRIVSLLPADPRAIRQAEQSGMPVVSAPPADALHGHLADADIAQLHFWNSPVVHAWMASELPPMRVLAWCHVNGLHAPHILSKSLFDFADIVAASSELSLDLPVFRQADPEKVDFVLAGADFSRVEGAHPVAHDGINVGYVGLVDFVKMHPEFVKLCAAVNAAPIRFHVCGEGSSRNEVERQARELGIHDRFVFVDHAEDIRPVLSSFDIFGYPLCAETYATSELALQEAMHAGVPPVVFSAGGLDKLVSDGRNGLVVTSDAEYVQAIERLCNDSDERLRLGRNAAIDARQLFGAQRTARGLQSLYERLLRTPKRQRPESSPAATNTAPSPGAWALVRSLDGIGDSDLLASLRASGAGDVAADDRIARAGPGLSSVILQYRLHYPHDPHLRLWAGLLFAHAGRRALAAAEFKACLDLGLDQPRLHRYFSAVASPVQSRVQL